MAETPTAPAPSRNLAGILYLSATITVVAGIVLGFVVSPALFAIVAVGIFDFVFAGLIASGRIGPDAQRRRAAAEQGDAAAVAEADPSFNPYARED